jgi:predicted DsbA family dithiol-disulfide isomerase
MQIDLFHDTACPWCRIGKRHLQLALAQWDGEPVEVRYRTFFLNERMPMAGEDFEPYMQAKVGGRVSLEQMFAGPRQAGARWAQQAGISGVPFFIVDDQYAWSGAQPSDAILQMLRQIDGTRN